ncbi:hypothetical protein G7Y89_g3992 [Cudoniella acicularis]|uniref:Carrier domain-containing protein n=1 Tax=Cudoniella acicularis TaxID=354080 RepID=A0A8H4RR45_9HELO|nr:hypothetical protein G7Y89_g3992 [Cudoniella acicularis]
MAEDEHLQLSVLNDPPKVLDGPQILHHLIDWEKHTKRCAIDFKSKARREQYSYGGIHSCVTSLITRIQQTLSSTRSVQTSTKPPPQHVVPVLVPQSPGLYISQLAILESGGAFCPINLDAPKERVKFVVGDVAADLIITTREFEDAVSWENGPSILFVDEFPTVPETEPVSSPSRRALPDDLAYVIRGLPSAKRAAAPGLKLLLTIGEMLTTPIVKEFGGSDTQSPMLYGMYGPTEAAIHCTIYPKMKASTKPGNIGVPFDTVSTFIAAPSSPDGSMNFLPVEELGELVLGGPQLAHGYLNREEQNKLAFVDIGCKKYYRTGDKARQLPDGTIEILGRMSAGQVKLRGQRVELGEIEEAVYKHPGMKTVIAVVLNSALIVFALIGQARLDQDDILETCAKWLPKFMIPSEVVLLESFPYLPSGKVDKRKLEADYQARRQEEDIEGPGSVTPTTRIVTEILQELLGILPKNTRLAAAGLDSLMAIRVASKLRASGFNITTIAVLQADSLTSLIRLCEDSTPGLQEKPTTDVGAAMGDVMAVLNGHAKDVELIMPCTPLQSAMLSESAKNQKAYRNWVELELPGICEVSKVESAIHELAEHNSILRTGFTESSDSTSFVQVIWRRLQDSQLKIVKELQYELDVSEHTSLHHPIRIQILQGNPDTKLLMHIHHALYDAWALELILDDFDAILMGNSIMTRPPFANIVKAYADGILKTDDQLSEDYWQDHLAHLDLRQIPNFYSSRPSSLGLAIAQAKTSIPTSVIEAAARSLDSSPQSLFQAAYALILSSYLGSHDICFGTVFSGRTLPVDGVEDIAGPCLSTLPIRIDLSASKNVQELVKELNSTTRKHLEYSTVPLRNIKSACGVDPRQSLFDTLLIWQQTLHNFDHTRKHVNFVNTVDNLEFNLTLEVIPGVGNVELKANYQRSIFPEAQIGVLLRQIEQLVQKIIDSPTLDLDEIFNGLGDEVMSIENPVPENILKSESLVTPVERIAIDDPNRPAIDFAKSIDGDSCDLQRMSYAELNSRANQMGYLLLSFNTFPDELVCICMEKSHDLYLSILATAKVGSGYLPLTPDVPSERLRYILREANVKVVMTHSSLRSLFKPIMGIQVIYTDEVDFSIFSTQNIPPRSVAENLSYCVFTSGSTGTPKGVLVTQGNILSNLDVLEDLYPATKDSRFLQSCSQAFDVSVFEIFFTWRLGGCICSAVKDVIFRDIEKAIRVLNVTHLSLTPTVAALVDPKNVPQVKFLVTAGEAVTQKVFNAWANRGLYQGYGPSETTNICTINPRVTRRHLINNIGPPLANTSAFVLSPRGEFSLVPRGGEGEFCFGGTQVFRGYMDVAQEIGKIVHHPKYGRLYRSGDFGRLMPDGSLAFSGRKDDQVKIRGQRVELGEINNVMLKSKKVKDCTTMVIHGLDESYARLVCFWTSYSDNKITLECLKADSSITLELFSLLESVLPGYMVPSTLIPITHLPSTSQGKIDKRLLVQKFEALGNEYLDSVSKAVGISSDHQWTELERDIAKALVFVTKVPLDSIKPETSFFSLGIDSISAIFLSKTVRQTINVQVEISDILKYSSVIRLAEFMLFKTQDSHAGRMDSGEEFNFSFDSDFLRKTTDSFERAGQHVKTILPCTPLQEAMLSAGESSSENLYSNHVVIKVNGSLEKVKDSWKQMVRRHDVLRTCFVSTDMPRYAYAQIVLEEYDLQIGLIDSQEKQVSQLRNVDKKQGEYSGFQPPYSIDVRISSGDVNLHIFMHHALYDGVALAVLYQEVEMLYHDQSLPETVSMTPFLRHMSLVNTQESDEYWGGVLKGYTPKTIKRPQTEMQKTENATQTQRIKAACPLTWIEKFVKNHSTSLLAVCHAVWSSILSEHLQDEDVCFGNVVSGRTVPVEGIERLVAPCFNTIPARLQRIHTLSYLEAFRKFQALNANSLSFQLTPLRRTQSKFSPDGSRLFDTLFILQQSPRDLDSTIWSILEDDGTIDLPLVCEVVPKHSEDTLEIILHSHTSAISSDSCAALLKSFSERIQASLENPRRQLLDSEAKDRILANSIRKAEAKPTEVGTPSSTKVFTPEEKQIRGILSTFTSVPLYRIGRDMSIFRLGLDSINTVQVATRLRKLGHTVTASDILEHPTIAQLNSFLAQRRDKNPEHVSYDFETFDKTYRESICTREKITSDKIEAVRPCTVVQQGMVAQSLHSNGVEYVNSMWMELSSDVSISQLKHAWVATRAKHAMLRTCFVPTDEQKHPFVMVMYKNEQFSLPWYEGEASDSTFVVNIQRPWILTLLGKYGKHMLKFTAHHALYDAQSIQMILGDVAKAYALESISSRPPITLLLGAILCDSEEGIEAKKLFWRSEENRIVVNRFPDLSPLHVSVSASGVREIICQKSLAQLEESCRQNGVTVQAAGQATWAKILAAYTGETSTTFGMTLSGRSIHEDASYISFPSIVTLPVRCEISGTNADLLSRTMKSNALLHKHQFTPLTLIQKWAGFPEGRIFDTLFAYQKLIEFPDSTAPPWKIVRDEASVDYAISMEVQPLLSGKIILRLTFREDIMPVEHSEIILRHDLSPKIVKDLLSITPVKEFELPTTINLLHGFVERGAKLWPNKKALEFATCLGPGKLNCRSWTYEQLDGEANRIAQLLIKRNIKTGQIIAICFDKCPEASFAIIGILKAGCAYVALDPNAPVDRQRFIIEDSGAQLVLTAGKPGQSIKQLIDKEIIPLDSPGAYSDEVANKPTLSREVSSQDVAYCLYTSGTTGTPKGCLLTHENSVQAMLSFQRLFADHWTEESKWLQFASFHFDVSVLEQFWSWSVGICVASAPRDLIFEDIPGAVKQLGITHIDLTPSLARLLHPDDVPSLCKGVFITGGEQLKQEILDVWGEHACIYNGYGPTEATIGVTMYPRVPRNGKPSNIGPQFDNVGSFVLKPGTDLPVLRGGVGELCVSGKLVGKGYLNRHELTTERFPILKSFNERVYRTGDLVRILHDGSFIFLGRADDQIKLRGQRLELGEINEVIKKGTNVLQDVVTLVLKHTTQQKEQLVTFFSVKVQSEAIAPASMIPEIRDSCKARLPGYMVPTHFVPIKYLPLNANNKADVKQLASIYNTLSVDDMQKLSHSSKGNMDWSTGEKRVLAIIAKVLEAETLALTLCRRPGLKNAKISTVKNNPSIGGLVTALSSIGEVGQRQENAYVAATQHIAAFSQKHMASVCRELSIESGDVECISPCTPVQEGMIYRFLENDFALYFNSFGFNLNENIDPEKFLSAWERAVVQLQILRTKFVVTDDGYAQMVLKSVKVSWGNSSVQYENMGKSEALQTPYKLSLQPGSLGNIVTLRIFHGLYDGNSLTMLLRRVAEEYHKPGEIDYGPTFQSSLPFGPLARMLGEQHFWTEHLKNWSHQPILQLPGSQSDILATSTLDGIHELESFRKRMGVTPQAVIQAVWLSILTTVLSPNLTIGVVTSGRAIDFEGAEEVIGPLFNTVPFHFLIEPGMTFATLISKCHQFNMKMQDFQQTPLKDIQKWSPAKPGQPLFESLFVFQRSEPEDETFARNFWTQVEDDPVADYPLAFEATLNAEGNRLCLALVAQGSVLNQSRANGLLELVGKALRGILKNDGKSNVLNNNSIPIDIEAFSKGPALEPSSTTYPDHPDKSFAWTKETEIMRTEIASLAKIETHLIHEKSSIFELGLDSIDVIKLSSRLKKQHINIPVSVIIKSQTIFKLASNLSAFAGQETTGSDKLLQNMCQNLKSYLQDSGKLPDDVEAVLPATPLQQSIVNEMLNSKFKRYFNIEASRIHANVDLVRLEASVRMVVVKSPILRARFIEVDDPQLSVSFAQVIHRAGQNELVISTHTLPAEKSLEEFMNEFRVNCISMASACQALFQVHFVTDGEIRYLILAVSHALYDGTSIQSLHEDIYEAYHGEFSPRPDFMPFLEQVVQSTNDDAKRFWKATLSNLPPAAFPKQEVSKQTQSIVHRLEKKSRMSLGAIESLCKSSRITLQTLGQTCWALVLAQLIGQLDVVFGSVLSCRDSEEAKEVMFPLMNTVAVRSVLHGNLAEMLSYMQELGDTTRQYQHFPLGTVQAYALASRKDRHANSDTTLFDTLFIYQGRRGNATRESLYESVYGASEVEFLVCVDMEIVDDNLIWTTACKSTARTEDETHQIIKALDTVLERMITNVQYPTIISNSDGISVCGLPKFKTRNVHNASAKTPTINNADQEWSEVEVKIRKALRDISGVPEEAILKDLTIFHLGLDSILILKLPALLRGHGIKISVSEILKEQTISAMANCVTRAKPTSQQKPMDVDKILTDAVYKLGLSTHLKELDEEFGEIQQVIPVTAGQLYMIRQWQTSHGVLFYPIFSYAIPSGINKQLLDGAWKQLLKRHDILRTGFLEVGAEVVQVIYKNPKNEVIYNSINPAKANLSSPPLNLIIEESEKCETTLKLRIHHALYDGISLPLLIEELKSLYLVKELQSPAHGEFKTFIAHSLTTKPATKEKWISYLASTAIPSITNTRPSLPRNKKTEVFHSALQIRSLKQTASKIGVTIDALLLAAAGKQYALHISRKTPSLNSSISQVTIGIYLANRAPFGDDLSSLAAPTLNLLPLRVYSPLDKGIDEIAIEVQRDVGMIGSKEMVFASLEEIYQWAGTRVDCFVNVLKSTSSASGAGDEVIFRPQGDYGDVVRVVDEVPDEDMSVVRAGDDSGKWDAYLPTIDIEIRYDGDGKVDMGVFGPENMVSVKEAEGMIQRFTTSWG